MADVSKKQIVYAKDLLKKLSIAAKPASKDIVKEYLRKVELDWSPSMEQEYIEFSKRVVQYIKDNRSPIRPIKIIPDLKDGFYAIFDCLEYTSNYRLAKDELHNRKRGKMARKRQKSKAK